MWRDVDAFHMPSPWSIAAASPRADAGEALISTLLHALVEVTDALFRVVAGDTLSHPFVVSPDASELTTNVGCGTHHASTHCSNARPDLLHDDLLSRPFGLSNAMSAGRATLEVETALEMSPF